PQPGLNAYDAIAHGYDAQVQGDDWMRRALHRHFGRVFMPGMRVLDVGCGTGIDALLLARRGIHVTAVDFSSAMIDQLRAKLSGAAYADRVDARVLGVDNLRELRGQPFDGVMSAFAGLSAVDDLTGFARDTAALLRPGGR